MESNEKTGAGREMTVEEKRDLTRRVMLVNSVAPSGIFSFHTQFDMVKQFHVGALGRGNCVVGNLALTPNLAVLLNRFGIIREEFSEEGGIEYLGQIARGEVEPNVENLAALLDWIVDMNYFLMGLAVNIGLPYDTAFLAVHNANMQKVLIPGGPTFREDGKVNKPVGWVSPKEQVIRAVEQQKKNDEEAVTAVNQ